jgi:clan AA aspartic protease (TIGR02281 family)
MKSKNGVKYIPCEVNGVALDFIFDSGASNVSLSLTEALFLIKNDKISNYDILGYSKAKLANGELVENTDIILREIKIGNIVLEDVRASVVNNLDAPLLLGQSVISRLGKVVIADNQLTIYPKKNNAFNGKIYDINKLFFEINGKFISKTAFLKSEGFEAGRMSNVGYQIVDLDGNDNPEIVFTLNTGGTACCTELYVFTIYNNRCYFVDKIPIGQSVTLFIDNKIEFIDYDMFRYFYTCGSCNFEVPNYVPMRERYILNNNKFIKHSFGLDYNNSIIENLNFLSQIKEDTYDEKTEFKLKFDRGERKAFLQQLFLYKEYNNSIKQAIYELTDTYYPFNDNLRIYEAIDRWF